MVLAVFAGLPGAGKSALAQRVGAALPASVLLLSSAAESTEIAGRAATELSAGRSVIVDGDPGDEEVRELWVEISDKFAVPLRVIEVVSAADWENAAYRPYRGPRLVVDTELAVEPVGSVLSYLA